MDPLRQELEFRDETLVVSGESHSSPRDRVAEEFEARKGHNAIAFGTVR